MDFSGFRGVGIVIFYLSPFIFRGVLQNMDSWVILADQKTYIYIYLSDIFAKDREIVIDSHDIQHVPWQFFVTCDNFSVTSNEGERVFVSLGHR